jgi:hypothetical protein
MPRQNETTRTRRSRSKTALDHRLDNRLMAYVAAAGGTTLAMLVAAPSEAEVVYTPTNVTIGPGASYPLDLNQDGIADFTLHRGLCGQHGSCFYAQVDVDGNGIRPTDKLSYAAPMPRGASIGPGQPFNATSGYSHKGAFMAADFIYSRSVFFGPWAYVNNRFLGVKFLIDGEIHYGWARLTVTNFTKGGTAVLTGYAYENVPNREIRAGQENGTVATAVGQQKPLNAEPGRLGSLALGSSAFAVWRRDEITAMRPSAD